MEIITLINSFFPRCAHCTSGEANGISAEASTLGDLKATRNRKFCRKLVNGNWT